MHVHEPYPHGVVFEGVVYDSEIIEKLQNKAKEILNHIVAELRAQQIDAEPIFLNGRPFIDDPSS